MKLVSGFQSRWQEAIVGNLTEIGINAKKQDGIKACGCGAMQKAGTPYEWLYAGRINKSLKSAA
nr:hypothetical protein [uncultured Pseudodesulfovibrio sp.]